MPPLAPPVVPPGTLATIPQPVLRSPAAVLRPFEAKDVDGLVEVYADPDIQRWHVRSLTEREAADWISGRSTCWTAESACDWAVIVEGALAGRIGLRAMDLEAGAGEVVYWTAPGHRRRGLASAALATLTDWAFAVGFGRLELLHSVHNAGSCRVAASGGFRLEGTKAHAGLHADGWHDMHLHARIAANVTSCHP